MQAQSLSVAPPSATVGDHVQVGTRAVPLRLVHNPRARRYLLRLSRDGAARVTVPRGGSLREARRFIERHLAWLDRQLARQAAERARPTAWTEGTVILLHGTATTLARVDEGARRFVVVGSQRIRVPEDTADLRPFVERALWALAARLLPPRVTGLAAAHGFRVGRITVRNQRSRWGSCSRRGTISLNWRIIQAPDFVRDYLILHELMHLRHMNHSARFWQAVATVCPEFELAETWLKAHTRLLR